MTNQEITKLFEDLQKDFKGDGKALILAAESKEGKIGFGAAYGDTASLFIMLGTLAHQLGKENGLSVTATSLMLSMVMRGGRGEYLKAIDNIAEKFKQGDLN